MDQQNVVVEVIVVGRASDRRRVFRNDDVVMNHQT